MSNMKLTLHIWRQRHANDTGTFETHVVDANEHMSFLEMLDVLNQTLIEQKKEPVAFEHDCREGICGACSMVINGRPHGPLGGTTACQLHMRHFQNGDHIWVEPFRAKAFPVIRDLVVDRGSFDRIIQAGGFVSVNTGAAVDGNTIPIEKDLASQSMDLPCSLPPLKPHISASSHKAKWRMHVVYKLWYTSMIRKVSAAAQTPMPAKQNALRKSPYQISLG